MYLDAEERKAALAAENRVSDGMMFKLDFDPRIIGSRRLPDGTIKKGLGNKIRDWSIDEFPQFWNVLKGDMSLVGTRPPTEDEWVKYELHHRSRLAIKPGITGMWQVSGRSEITDFEQVFFYNPILYVIFLLTINMLSSIFILKILSIFIL
jgi:lipopolysaccharide/colanic/teichoic acid biosynthesis glycosyltransferase